MLKVTDKALDILSQTLETNEVPGEQGLRLARADGGEFGLAIDQARDGDEVVSHGERPILFVEPEISETLDGATLDVTESVDGARLTLRMPGEPE